MRALIGNLFRFLYFHALCDSTLSVKEALAIVQRKWHAWQRRFGTYGEYEDWIDLGGES